MLGNWQEDMETVARYEWWWSLCQKRGTEHIIFFLFHSEDFVLLKKEMLGAHMYSRKELSVQDRTAWHPQHLQEGCSWFVHQAWTTAVETLGKLKQGIYLNVYSRELPAGGKWVVIKQEKWGVKKKLHIIKLRSLQNKVSETWEFFIASWI